MIYPDLKQTKENVASHYDTLDPFYRLLWGEHLHHGYWSWGSESIQSATEKLVELVAQKGKISRGDRVLDIGSGYGAASRYLAEHYGAFVTGITLSRTQWEYAQKNSLSGTQFVLGDFLSNDLPDGSFDSAISIESSEHMEDKEKFFDEVHRILKTGGRGVVCAWLAKEEPRQREIDYLLEPICREGRLPSLGSETEYREWIRNSGLRLESFEDASSNVKKTWSICVSKTITSFFTNSEFRSYLLNSESSDRRFAKTVFRMLAAYQLKVLRYGIFSFIKD